MKELSHINAQGEAQMVDVGAKAVTQRQASAAAWVRMQPQTLEKILQGEMKKGDVLTVARIAGIQGAKKCADLIPLCHPLMLTGIDVQIIPDTDNSRVRIVGRCRLAGKTGVEMEALTAVSVAALTLYDMCKAVDRGMVIESIGLLDKAGGASGSWQRETDEN